MKNDLFPKMLYAIALKLQRDAFSRGDNEANASKTLLGDSSRIFYIGSFKYYSDVLSCNLASSMIEAAKIWCKIIRTYL